jgi:hypothetical protein
MKRGVDYRLLKESKVSLPYKKKRGHSIQNSSNSHKPPKVPLQYVNEERGVTTYQVNFGAYKNETGLNVIVRATFYSRDRIHDDDDDDDDDDDGDDDDDDAAAAAAALWPESSSELYRPSDRRLLMKLVPTSTEN